MNKEMKRFLVYNAAMAPAVLLGVIVMAMQGEPAVLSAQQIGALIVFPLLAWALSRPVRRLQMKWMAAALTAFLALSLLGPGVGGVRRWVDLGIFNVNAAMLVLPALLAASAGLHNPCAMLLTAGVVLSLQPDLSQLAALAAAAAALLIGRCEKRWGIWTLAAFAALLIRCALAPAMLEPSAASEGILFFMRKQSLLLFGAGWLTLALTPLSFLRAFLKGKTRVHLALAVYYVVIMLFGASGQYPVPLLGFGMSPIAGCALAQLGMREDGAKTA